MAIASVYSRRRFVLRHKGLGGRDLSLFIPAQGRDDS